MSALVPAASLPVLPDPVALLLADKRSPATRRAYESDLRHFFGRSPTPEAVQDFVSLSAPEIALRLAQYKAAMLTGGLSEATVNRRLAAVRSLLKLCFRLGFARTDGRGLVDSEKVTTYRDTRGVDLKTLRRILAAPGTDTLRGLRDTAILRLLCENAIRRGELCAVDVDDFSLTERRVLLLGKGKGTQKEPITISRPTAEAIAAYLVAAGHASNGRAPLFLGMHHSPEIGGQRLTPNGLYWLVGDYGRRVDVPKLTPHKLRHSAITAALDATSGNVRAVQRLSRHRDVRTLQRYDDNRTDMQGEVTRTLADLLGEPKTNDRARD